MAKKRKTSAKKTKKSAPPKPAAARAKPAKRPKARRSGSNMGTTGNARPHFATFEEAKSAALDTLIRSIEDAERRLSAAKRATTYEELHRLSI